jgi:hypothetical protein
MKNLLLTASLFLTSSMAAIGAPLSFTGIPREAQGVIHIDFDAARSSKTIQAVLQKEKLDGSLSLNLSNLGVNLFTEIKDVTVGIFDKAGEKKYGGMVGVLRGNFSEKNLAEHAKKQGAKISNKNGKLFIDYSFVKDRKFDAPPLTWRGVSYFLDAKTILLLEEEKYLNSFIASAKNTTLSPLFSGLEAYNKKHKTPPVIIASVRGSVLPSAPAGNEKEPAPEHLYLVLADNGYWVSARIAASCSTPAIAKQLEASLQGAIGFMTESEKLVENGGGSLGNGVTVRRDPTVSKGDIALKKYLFSSIKSKVDGKVFRVSVDMSSAKIIKFLKEK